MAPKELLTYADVQEMLSCARASVERLWKVHKLIPPPRKYRGLGLRWRRQDILDYLHGEYHRREEPPARPPISDK